MTNKRLSASRKFEVVIPTQQDCSTPCGITIYLSNPKLRAMESQTRSLDGWIGSELAGRGDYDADPVTPRHLPAQQDIRRAIVRLTKRIKNAVLEETHRAARRMAGRYEKRSKDAWMESWGFIYLSVTGRIKQLPNLPEHFELWLSRTAFGEARKYYRVERASSLV